MPRILLDAHITEYGRQIHQAYRPMGPKGSESVRGWKKIRTRKGSVGYCTCYKVESMLSGLGRHQVETRKG